MKQTEGKQRERWEEGQNAGEGKGGQEKFKVVEKPMNKFEIWGGRAHIEI